MHSFYIQFPDWNTDSLIFICIHFDKECFNRFLNNVGMQKRHTLVENIYTLCVLRDREMALKTSCISYNLDSGRWIIFI